jgi:hypothetical protein
MALCNTSTGCASRLVLSIGTSIDLIQLLFPEIYATFWYYVIFVWYGGFFLELWIDPKFEDQCSILSRINSLEDQAF